jgi:uncharacterized membrane protein
MRFRDQEELGALFVLHNIFLAFIPFIESLLLDFELFVLDIVDENPV